MSKNNNTQKIVGLGLFTAIVIVLQLMGSFIRFGTFSISLVLVPVVIGAALYGAGAGAWLGFVFGVVVLLSGDAAAFLGVNALGTILTVLVKGARGAVDFDYEKNLFDINNALSGVDTLILPASKEVQFVSSTFVRELIRYGKPLDRYVPKEAIPFLVRGV